MVLSGRALVEDESALVADVKPDPWPPDVLAADEPGGDPDELLSRWQALVAARITHAGRAADASPAEVAWLVPAMEDRNLRDALLVSLASEHAEAAEKVHTLRSQRAPRLILKRA